MKKILVFPMTANAFIASVCAISGVGLLLFFFLAPSPPVYTKLQTEIGEVTAILPAIRNDNYLEDEEAVSVKFNDGSIIYMNVPKRKQIQIGQLIEVDMLESDREKLIYRLAQDTIQP